MKDSRNFDADRTQIPALMAFVTEHAEAAGLHPRRCLQLQLAVEEAVVNICDYAYETPPGSVAVEVEQDGDRLTIALRDDGIPFDPLALDAPDLQAPLEERKLGGLGIFLIGQVVDEVRYCRENGQNILTLKLATSR